MISIVHELRIARNQNDKLAVLRRERNNKNWRDYLRMVCDEHVIYCVTAPSDQTYIDDDQWKFSDLLDDLRLLSQGSGQKLKRRKQAVEMSQKYGECFRLAIGHSLKAGVTKPTLRKAYPGLLYMRYVEKLDVVEVKEGTGMFAGMVGSLRCTGNDGAEADVVLGLNYTDRILEPEDYLDHQVEVMFDSIEEGRYKEPIFVRRIKK